MLASKRTPCVPICIIVAAVIAIAVAAIAGSFVVAEPDERIVNGTFDADLSGWNNLSYGDDTSRGMRGA